MNLPVVVITLKVLWFDYTELYQLGTRSISKVQYNKVAPVSLILVSKTGAMSLYLTIF